jgi:hypothetical protein
MVLPLADIAAAAAAAPLPNNPWMGTLPNWLSAGAAILALGLAAFSAWWAAKQWRLQHFTSEWGKTVQFLHTHAKFIDPATNQNYKTQFTGEELRRYELVARLSIAYVDDLYHLKMGKHLESWMKGSVQLFVKPHKIYFSDNTDAYSPEFVKEMNELLGSV